jgi:hypothetical protein
MSARDSLERAERSLREAKDAHQKAQDKLNGATAAREQIEANPPREKTKKGKDSADSSPQEFGKSLGKGLLQMAGLDGSVLDNPLEWGGVKWLTGLINNFVKPAQDQTGSTGGQLLAAGVGADALPGGGGSLALPGLDPGSLPALPGLSPVPPQSPRLGADGATASPDVAASLAQAPGQQQAQERAGPTSIDQSIRFNGQVGADAGQVARQVQSGFNTRNRAVNLTVGRQT